MTSPETLYRDVVGYHMELSMDSNRCSRGIQLAGPEAMEEPLPTPTAASA